MCRNWERDLSFHEAIEAMKNAHKEEMEKTHRSQLSGLNSDIDELRLQYEYVGEV